MVLFGSLLLDDPVTLFDVMLVLVVLGKAEVISVGGLGSDTFDPLSFLSLRAVTSFFSHSGLDDLVTPDSVSPSSVVVLTPGRKMHLEHFDLNLARHLINL